LTDPDTQGNNFIVTTRTKVFLSYSHDDERWRERLAGHLGVLDAEGIIELWDDRRLDAGDDWFARIHEQMLSARIAVLLVSSAFLTSRFVREEEVPRLFARHQDDGMVVYPLLIRPCPWQEVGWLARMQLRPREGKAVASFRGAKVDEILAEVAREISSIAQNKNESAHSPQRPPRAARPSLDVTGEWRADVIYDWPNAKYAEVFTFKVDDGDVLGTATFLGRKRALHDGKLNGTKITFTTKSQESCGADESREVRHQYRGKISGDEIKFVMLTEGGYSEHVPIEFSAKRVSRPGRVPDR
jgi:hypothetical protein